MYSHNISMPLNRIQAFCEKWKVKELALFGSVLRQDFRPDSDIDVLITTAEDHVHDLYSWIDMIDELSLIFGRKVHLVSRGGLRNPFRRERILNTAEIVYAA